jgi:hypothetical protein
MVLLVVEFQIDNWISTDERRPGGGGGACGVCCCVHTTHFDIDTD